MRKIQLFGVTIQIPNKMYGMMVDEEGAPGGNNFITFLTLGVETQDPRRDFGYSLEENSKSIPRERFIQELEFQVKACEQGIVHFKSFKLHRGFSLDVYLGQGLRFDVDDHQEKIQKLKNTKELLQRIIIKLQKKKKAKKKGETIMNRKAFTLIELLIVVAIIGILAAIAVPNFLNASVRAKVARVESDLKALATAQQAYRLDYGRFTPCSNEGVVYPDPLKRQLGLTTPYAYISSLPRDVFSAQSKPVSANAEQERKIIMNPPYYYLKGYTFRESEGWPTMNIGAWRVFFTKHFKEGGYNAWLSSRGPGGVSALTDSQDNPEPVTYNPSNGIVSVGYIQRSEK